MRLGRGRATCCQRLVAGRLHRVGSRKGAAVWPTDGAKESGGQMGSGVGKLGLEAMSCQNGKREVRLGCYVIPNAACADLLAAHLCGCWQLVIPACVQPRRRSRQTASEGQKRADKVQHSAGRSGKHSRLCAAGRPALMPAPTAARTHALASQMLGATDVLPRSRKPCHATGCPHLVLSRGLLSRIRQDGDANAALLMLRHLRVSTGRRGGLS